MTGMSISQYVKNRRLYLAAVEILKGAKVIDTAVKYCYTTPESFSKAFYRFHGLTPLNLKKHPERIKVFQPISFSISISGGEKLKVRFENLKSTKLIGFSKTFTFDEAYKQIPVFWKEKLNSILSKCWKMNQSVISSNQITDLQKAVIENNIGCFGASFDCEGEHFKYGILGVVTSSPTCRGNGFLFDSSNELSSELLPHSRLAPSAPRLFFLFDLAKVFCLLLEDSQLH